MGNDQSRSSDGGGLVDGMCCTKRKADATIKRQPVPIEKSPAVVKSWADKGPSQTSSSGFKLPLPSDKIPSSGPVADKVGIGAYFHKSADNPDYLCIKSMVDGPAKRCGKIQVGDCIVSVDGKLVSGQRLAELADHLLGPRDSSVALKFKKPASETFYEVTIKRGL